MECDEGPTVEQVKVLFTIFCKLQLTAWAEGLLTSVGAETKNNTTTVWQTSCLTSLDMYFTFMLRIS